MSPLPNREQTVAIATCPPSGESDASIQRALLELSAALGWSTGSGSSPFASTIPPDSRVVVKPNWVSHVNNSGHGLQPLVTDSRIVRSVVEGLLQSGVRQVIVGDAPIQSCDMQALLAANGLEPWAADLTNRAPSFAGIRDFRRVIAHRAHGTLVQHGTARSIDDFVLFDLGTESLLDGVTTRRNRFRVTQYNPDEMAATHGVGRHQYLVARELVDANVVINLPKLKTHQKAGLTCALKNLVGINGDKAFLPHHRIRSPKEGGDCYPGPSVLKRMQETTLDFSNRRTSHVIRVGAAAVSQALSILARRFVDSLGVEGSWSGNDTVWRMCLDLNRILLYGRGDGKLAEIPQRRVFTIVDAIVAGEGYGPLAPEPFALGLMIAGESAAAVDWICAQLLGYNPHNIPLVREAFSPSKWPISQGGADRIVVKGSAANDFLARKLPLPHSYPLGWLSAVDLTERKTPPKGLAAPGRHAALREPTTESA
jgi:uncharacterized protein (DUF362 family)